MRLLCPESGEHGPHRAAEDLRIEPRRHVLDVVEVVRQLVHRLRFIVGVSVVDLRPPGDTGPDEVALSVERDGAFELRREDGSLRTRTDETEVSLEHIPELRNFIDASATHPATGACETAVAGFGELRAVLFCILNHGAELVQDEEPAATPDANLSIDGGSW